MSSDDNKKNDISIEPDLEYGDNPKKGDKLQELKEKLSICQKEKEEYLDGWQRARAEIINQGKRFQQDLLGLEERSAIDTIKGLLPLFDSLESAKKHSVKEIEPIYQQYISMLESLGISRIVEEGVEFDPNIHQSIKSEKVEKEMDNKVIEVVQIGYALKGKIIRPALVIVGHFEGN